MLNIIINAYRIFLLQKSSQPPLSSALVEMTQQCVSHTALVLQGTFTQSRYEAKPKRDTLAFCSFNV